MPIENERKYVLRQEVEKKLNFQDRFAMRQAYLPSGHSDLTYRLREIADTYRIGGQTTLIRIFTIKCRNEDGTATEVEFPLMAEKDFLAYWGKADRTLSKVRYLYYHDVWSKSYKWEIDVFKDEEGKSYFWMAEIELPEGKVEPPEIPDIIRDNLVYKVPLTDRRFSSMNISNISYAKELLKGLYENEKI